MGFDIYLEVESGQDCPHWSVNRPLVHWLVSVHVNGAFAPDHLGDLAESLGVDTTLLKTLGHQGLGIEDYYAYIDDSPPGRVKELWEKDQQSNRDSWQRPQDFVVLLEAFVGGLRDNPDIYERLEIEEEYFVNGVFKEHMSALLAAARWAVEQGEATMRLVVL